MRAARLRYPVAAQVFGLTPQSRPVFAVGRRRSAATEARAVLLASLILGAAVALAREFPLTAKHIAFQGKAPEPGEGGALLARRHKEPGRRSAGAARDR